MLSGMKYRFRNECNNVSESSKYFDGCLSIRGAKRNSFDDFHPLKGKFAIIS